MLLNSDSNAPGIHPSILDSLTLPDYPKELKQQFYMEMERFFHEIGILRRSKGSCRNFFMSFVGSIFKESSI